MPHALNLVCTRCTDNNHAALQRWYNDHAQLLMASPQLQGAELFKMKAATASLDYFCLYHFGVLSDFAAFDSGEVMSQVREMSNVAAGRSSIEIVKRTQYERVLNRCWASEKAHSQQAAMLQLQDGGLAETLRWFNDVLYQMHTQNALLSAQIYVAQMQADAEIFVVFQLGAQPLPVDWLDWLSPYAQRGKVKAVWQAQAECIGHWLR